MKFFHLADLHLGKRVHDFSMIEDQEAILKQILDAAQEEAPEGVLLAGDIYDKSTPSAQAVDLFDSFLVELAKRVPHIYIIPGNHDSADRLAFGGRLMASSGVHIALPYRGPQAPFVLEDNYGPLYIHLLPYLKPATVQPYLPDEPLESYSQAVAAAIGLIKPDFGTRNILIAHQFVAGGERSDSERIIVGGSDNVAASVFDGFDYVALGHLHGPQNILGPTIRYAGSPLKYSFSEKAHIKSITIVDIKDKGQLSVRTLPLKPRHDLREIRGRFDDLIEGTNENEAGREDYIRAILTDEEDPPMALARLRKVYPNIMRLDYDNTRSRHQPSFDRGAGEQQSGPNLFSAFYENQNGKTLSPEQKSYVESLFKSLEEEAI